jgi:hypothetical protein
MPPVTPAWRRQALASTAAAVKFQIRKGGTTGNGTTDLVFECSMYITDFNHSFGQNDSVKATGTLVAAAAPTTDTLA